MFFKGEIMSGRILEIAQNNRLLCIQRGCIEILDNESKKAIAHIALDDLDGLLVTGHGIWLSANLLARLAELGINVVFSNQRYRPVAILLGVDNNCLQGQRMIAQHDASLTLNKRLWQDIVQTKLSFQASLLQAHQQQQANQIKILIKNVKSGDPSNLEAQGAKYYWQGLMREHLPDFRREQSANDLINICLNYGYTVLRIAVAKQILASGLHTGWGIHHCHPNNTMPLADDLMEPFRVMVDAKVYALCKQGYISMNNSEVDQNSSAEQSVVFSTLSPEIKKALVDVIYTDILIQGEHKPFMNYLQMLSNSLVKVYMGDAKCLSFPDVKQIDWHDFEALPQFKNTPKILPKPQVAGQ
jgi:CRISP-associated protein Cas1